jgi:hypothetical protein
LRRPHERFFPEKTGGNKTGGNAPDFSRLSLFLSSLFSFLNEAEPKAEQETQGKKKKPPKRAI